jgi:sugar lactone lactonase YvrE
MPETLLDGLTFPEGPRWHQGRLWFSDFYNHRVIAVGLGGKTETIVTVPNIPSGLGWLPDGTLLVVSMDDRKLLRLQDGVLSTHGDLSSIAAGPCNDMVVDTRGRAYVGNFGYDRFKGEEARAARMARVDPDGTVSIVADDLLFPNGTVITPDGRTLIVGESMGNRLTAFDIGDDGGLSDRRVWAETPGIVPDGICLDEEGAIWVADPRKNRVVRVRPGGAIADTISLPGRQAFACMLGGDDRRTLFICTAPASGPDRAGKSDGMIEIARVTVPGTGLP